MKSFFLSLGLLLAISAETFASGTKGNEEELQALTTPVAPAQEVEMLVDLSLLPTDLFGRIGYFSDRDRVNLALTSNRVARAVTNMSRQVQKDYWMQVDSLLQCQTIFDFSKTHFDFFRRIARGFPLMFNRLDANGLTALHKTILARNVMASLFLMCHNVRRDITANITEDDGQGNVGTRSVTVATLIQEGNHLPAVHVNDHYCMLLRTPETRFEVERNCTRGFLLPSNFHSGTAGNLADDAEFLDLAVNYPNAITESGNLYYGSHNRLIHDCVKNEQFDLFQLFIRAGAAAEFDAGFLYSRCDPSHTNFLLQQGLLSKKQIEELMCYAAGNCVPAEQNYPKGIPSSRPSTMWPVMSYIKTDLEELELFLHHRGKTDINTVVYGRTALDLAVANWDYWGHVSHEDDRWRLFEKAQQKVELLVEAGADPHVELTPTRWQENETSFYSDGVCSPVVKLLNRITAHTDEPSEAQEYKSARLAYLKVLKDMLKQVPRLNHLIEFVAEPDNCYWFCDTEVCSLLLGVGINPLTRDNMGQTLLCKAIRCLRPDDNSATSDGEEVFSDEAGDDSSSESSSSLENYYLERSKMAFETVKIILDNCKDNLTEEHFTITDFDESEALMPEHLEFLKSKGFVFKR